MSCIVQKFGGTSVATLERIQHVADIIARTYRAGNQVLAVVSAMAGVTNRFVEYAHNLHACEGEPEYDSVVSSGELVTSGLLAIALKNLGIDARSYASWQVPISTDNNYGQAKILHVDNRNLLHDIDNGIIPVISGFQGVSSEHKITTLGRGGSDLTAVAVAASVKADICEIYSDVDGIYTVDPNLYSDARKIDQISDIEMLEMSAHGAKVMQERSVDYAMQKNVTIKVVSSFVDNGGTIISKSIAPKKFSGLAVAQHLARIHIVCVANDNCHKIDSLLAQHFIRAEVCEPRNSKEHDILIDKEKVATAINVLNNCDFVTEARQEVIRKGCSRISVIGKCNTDSVVSELVHVLNRNHIDVLAMSYATYRINFVIAVEQLMSAISILHKYCGLEHE